MLPGLGVAAAIAPPYCIADRSRVAGLPLVALTLPLADGATEGRSGRQLGCGRNL